MLTGKRVNALPRHEIARGKRGISHLFARGSRLRGDFLLMISSPVVPGHTGRGSVVRVLFTVAKKQFSRAVDRNRIKRLMREAYRHEKIALQGFMDAWSRQGGGTVFIAFLYRGGRDVVPSLNDFRTDMRQMMQAFISRTLKPAPDGDEGH